MPAILRMQRHVVLPFALAVTVAVAMFGFTPRADAAVSRARGAQRAVQIAQNQIGDPYGHGGDGPGSFDCSGLVYYSYRSAGFSHIPRTAAAQASVARRISSSSMRPGDLVFYTGGGGVYHVAIYAGRHRMIEAAHPGTSVRRVPVHGRSWFAGRMR